MLYPDPQREGLAAAVASLAKASTAKELAALVELGVRSKPYGYDRVVSGIAQRYAGDQVAIIKAALQRRYPNAGDMPISPANFVAMFARADAGVYVVDADRYLVRNGEALDEGDARAQAFTRVLEDIGMATLMPELERRALTGAKAMAVELCWRKISDDDDGRPTAQLYWTSDVIVLCHPTAPNDQRAIMVCALRQTPSSATPQTQRWSIYSRKPFERPDGRVAKWGPWQHIVISSDGDHASLPVELPNKRLPVVFLRTEQTSGGFWPVPEADVIAQSDELNISRANEQHTVDMQGHGQGVYAGNQNETKDLILGPDRLVAIGQGESITSIDFDPKLEDMRASRGQMMRESAVTRAQNPDAMATTPTVAVSGISRAIANLPHDNRVRELRPVFKEFEKRWLMPAVLEMCDLFSKASYAPTFGSDVEPEVIFGVPPNYEELDTKQRRLKEDRDDGIISPARYAVLMGHYDDVRAAVADGLSNELKAKAKPALPPGMPPAPPAPAPPPDPTPEG